MFFSLQFQTSQSLSKILRCASFSFLSVWKCGKNGLFCLIAYLKVASSFLVVFKRTFCDEDKALISCPPELRLVFHNTPFYGQVNSSESCPASGPTPCISDLTYDGIEDFCDRYSCDIPGVSGNKLGLKGQYQCKDSSNYLTVYHSCQQSK